MLQLLVLLFLFLIKNFLLHHPMFLTWTQNNGTLPVTNLPASVHVYQNGQKLIESQYVITAPATITIDANTHYDGSNYIVFAINII
jgi:hypothetical protein